MKLSMGIGVGLFIGFIGLKNGGLIIDNASTYLSLGDIRKPETLLAGVGFILIAILSIKKIQGAIIIGILSITLIAQLLGLNCIHYQNINCFLQSWFCKTVLQLEGENLLLMMLKVMIWQNTELGVDKGRFG